MKNKILLTATVIFIILLNTSQAQSIRSDMRLPQGLGISNHLEYSYDQSEDYEILENWLNLDYRLGDFTAGFRFDVFQPNDPNPAISRGKERYADISYKYIKYDLGKSRQRLNITVGNFYGFFGRGMILKSYEDRNIRIDNNLLGVKVEGRYNNLKITALSGMAENANAERKDVLHAADVVYKLFRQLSIGASYAHNQPANEALGRTSLASVRVLPRIWNFDFYAEYGIKQNPVVEKNVFNDNESIIGKGIYSSVNFFIGSFGIAVEYKYYDNFAFTSSDGTIYYNTPPSLRKDYPFVLLNRHPSALDANNEQGLQLEATYSYGNDSYFSASVSQTNTLDKNSFHQRVNNFNLDTETQLKEVYVQSNHRWNKKLKTIAAFGYNEELASNTKNMSPIIELDYYPSQKNTFRFTVEHMFSTDRSTTEQFYSDVILIEYLRSPKFSVGVLGEIQTREPTPGNIERNYWGFIQFGYQIFENTDLSLLIGTRQAGNICIGGVCRYEPEFSGVEFKMITNL